MSNRIRSFLWSILCVSTLSAQVGIGTANVSPGAILQLDSTTGTFVLPRMNDAQMNAITTIPEGALLFNNNENVPYFRGLAGWTGFDLSSNPTIILSRTSGTFPTSPTLSQPLLLTASNIQSGSSAYFTVTGTGKIKVLRGGVYLISAALSTTNLPAGSRNYLLAAYKNNDMIAYLSRSRLDNPIADYWGTTGSLMYAAEAGDEFSFRYYINHNAPLTTAFNTICITKLN